jgi:hypothetical protein
MKFRVPEIILGALLAVAVFAIGALFASSYQPSPAAKNQSQQAEPAGQNGDASKPPVADHAKNGQAAQHKEEKSEFWSAKLTDWLLAVFTFFLVAFTYRLWKSTEKLWETTDASVKLAREEFITSHRPWLRVDVEIFGPFEYWPNDMASCSFKITIMNIGTAPAHKVLIDCEMMIGPDPSVRAIQSRLADAAKTGRVGPSLFPNQPLNLDMRFEISLDRLKKIKPLDDGTVMFVPELIGVVSYDAAISDQKHQTGFHYHITRYEPDWPAAKMFFRHLGNVPPKAMGIDRSLYGNSLLT